MSRYFKTPLKGFDPLNWIPGDGGTINIKVDMMLNNIDTKGKKIIFQFDNHCFISSLGMEGHWTWEPEKHTGITIYFEDRVVYYSDSRRFGSFHMIHNSSYNEIMKDVGPDYLKGEVSLELFTSKITNSRISRKEIVSFMMDQSILSCVGNYIKADSLYLARISPYRTLGTLSQQDIYNLYHSIMYVLNESYRCKGLTIQSYKDPDGNRGSYNHIIYKRSHTNEGYPVITCTLSDKRTTHWCPSVQI